MNISQLVTFFGNQVTPNKLVLRSDKEVWHAIYYNPDTAEYTEEYKEDWMKKSVIETILPNRVLQLIDKNTQR